MPTNLLNLLETRAEKRAATTAADRAAATSRYWDAIDALASGDASGACDRVTFENCLAVMGLSIDQAKADVAEVQRVRAMQAAVATAQAEVEASSAAADEAFAARDRAKAALLRLEDAASRAGWRHHEATTALTSARIAIRDEGRDAAALLRSRGFRGELLDAPPPPPPPRRWRFRDRSNRSGRWLEAGSELDLPASVCLSDREAVLVGDVVPGMPAPVQVAVPLVDQRGETFEAAMRSGRASP